MWIKALFLRNFRSYEQARFEFCPQDNLIIGPNARGKTTVLEAIFLLMTGRSFRTSNIDDLVREGEGGFYIKMDFSTQGVDQSVRFLYDLKKKKIFINNHPCRQITDLLGLIQGVLLQPDDIQLIKGSPKYRRQFLDLQLAQMNPLYVHYLMRYYRAMKQRNVLLKQQRLGAIDVFEQEMAASGRYIIQERKELIDSLTHACQPVQRSLSEGREEVSLKYIAKCVPEQLMSKYLSDRSRELKLGYTLNGPHQDDLSLKLGQQEARHFASEGQKKTLTTALKFAEWNLLCNRTGSKPLMLIDDVGVSLDSTRREKLLSLLETFEQVFITSTDPIAFGNKNRQNLELRVC